MGLSVNSPRWLLWLLQYQNTLCHIPTKDKLDWSGWRPSPKSELQWMPWGIMFPKAREFLGWQGRRKGSALWSFIYAMCLWKPEWQSKVKGKAARYRPTVAQKVPGSWGSQISWQRFRIVVKLSALCTCRLYPQETHLVLISVRRWVDPRAIVRPEGLCHWKIPMTPSGIEPATCRFIA